MKTYKIHPDFYPDFQQAVNAAFEDTMIKTGKCEHIFSPEREPFEDGYIYLNVKDWIANLPDMWQFLAELTEVKQP